MKQLTQEQIKILEDAFAGYPEDYTPNGGDYNSMEGINRQLEKLNTQNTTKDYIFYITNYKPIVVNYDGKECTVVNFSIEKMKVGETK